MISKIESGGMADIFLGVQVGEEALAAAVLEQQVNGFSVLAARAIRTRGARDPIQFCPLAAGP